MKIDSSIFNLFAQRPRKAPVAETAPGATTPPQPRPPSLRSDAQRVDDFHARMAKQQLDWADANKDGSLTKAEYMDGQKRLAEANDRTFDSEASSERWAKLDPAGKGALDANALQEGLETLLPVKVGHLDGNVFQRLLARRTSD